jgi:hypothetical protein
MRLKLHALIVAAPEPKPIRHFAKIVSNQGFEILGTAVKTLQRIPDAIHVAKCFMHGSTPNGQWVFRRCSRQTSEATGSEETD